MISRSSLNDRFSLGARLRLWLDVCPCRVLCVCPKHGSEFRLEFASQNRSGLTLLVRPKLALEDRLDRRLLQVRSGLILCVRPELALEVLLDLVLGVRAVHILSEDRLDLELRAHSGLFLHVRANLTLEFRLVDVFEVGPGPALDRRRPLFVLWLTLEPQTSLSSLFQLVRCWNSSSRFAIGKYFLSLSGIK